ncbi:GDP-mannose 4,6-dehydratase [Methanoregula sp. UBA64]|jgi:GDPmannose 4,6-dehydratase|uniref:GDP-mannose 4,6-dehydratase n=1 Tax=Methanoregula sp. UBA64 TaxID=1915554 RepID=UPI0025E81F1F|nr:GDP-mannose 4,6-dehydratase [Methanoregula sp. UBA64]
MPRAIIVGVTGQDGTYLFRYLNERHYEIFGFGRTRIMTNRDDWKNQAHDITSFQEISNLIQRIQPDEIYHLAAFHQSSEDPVINNETLFQHSYEVNVLSLFHVLEALRLFSPDTHLFYAASSHIFGRPASEPQDETTPFNPLGIYAVTKVSGLHLCRMYRTLYHIHASTGILYNHESPIRSEQFVSQKIAKAAILCKHDPHHRLILGDLSVEVDWGYAPDYVDAMHRITTHQKPDDFIIATGKKSRVEDFVKIAFEYLGLDWHEYVTEKREIITKPAVALVGNPEKLERLTGWKRTVSFPEMVRLLVESAQNDL